MRTRTWTLLALLAPLPLQADALFGNSIAGDAELPRTWGVSVDYFAMQQPYDLDSLGFAPPVLPITDPGILPIENEVRHTDLKVDAWVLPFLNVFGLYGRIDGDTVIKLGVLGLPLPPAINTLTVDYDGDVFGGGIVLAAGGERWFASVTATMTDTELSGDFDSSVRAKTIQPRIGLRFGNHTELWLGGYLLDAEEKHSGTLELDLGPILAPDGPILLDFAVDLSQAQDFNPSIGMHMQLANAWEATVEVGGGDRRTALLNIGYRFE